MRSGLAKSACKVLPIWSIVEKPIPLTLISSYGLFFNIILALGPNSDAIFSAFFNDKFIKPLNTAIISLITFVFFNLIRILSSLF